MALFQFKLNRKPMKKSSKEFIFGAATLFLLFASSSHAETQAYTTNELISLIPVYASKSYTSGVFDNEKAEAFNRQNFGYDCQIFYPLTTRNGEGGGLGHQIFDDASRYLTEKNEKDKNEYAQKVKEGLSELQKRSVKVCTDGRGVEYFGRFQTLLSAILQAGSSISTETQRLIGVQNDSREKKYAEERKSISDAQAKATVNAACQRTPQYQAYAASYVIARNKPYLNSAQQEMQKQKDGAKISGYVDKNRMHELGNIISKINKENSEAFQIYTKFGGPVNEIGAVSVLANPCGNM